MYLRMEAQMYVYICICIRTYICMYACTHTVHTPVCVWGRGVRGGEGETGLNFLFEEALNDVGPDQLARCIVFGGFNQLRIEERTHSPAAMRLLVFGLLVCRVGQLMCATCSLCLAHEPPSL